MHVFKNVSQSTWDHIIGKKDTLLARQDMKSINQLPPSPEPRMGKMGKIVLPKAPWILSMAEQERVKGVIKSIQAPTGYMQSLKGAFTNAQKKGVPFSPIWTQVS